MSSTKPSEVSIDLDSCAPSETIVARTVSSVYELIVLGDELGQVLVRGGKCFTTFCSVLFVGSTRRGGPIERHTIEVGLRMQFCFEGIGILTSAVQSLSRHPTTAPAYCACTQSEQDCGELMMSEPNF